MADDDRHMKADHDRSRGRTLLYQEVADRLRRDIQAGFHPRGTYLPSEVDLCARFRVSRDTVRRALADLGGEGLIQSEPGVGHRVGGTVVSARQEENDLVAVIAPYGRDATAFAETVAGLERALASATMRLVVLSMPAPPPHEKQAVTTALVENVLHMRPRAVVCALPQGTDMWELQRLARADVPVVVVGEGPAGLAVDLVGTDDRLGTYMISEWLADWAENPPWCVSGAQSFSGLEARLEGYSLALPNRPDTVAERPVLTLSAESRESAVAQIVEWAHEHRGARRLGLVCTQPQLVRPVARGLEEAGVVVGDGAAIGCVQSLWQARMPDEVPTATAVWSAAEMGASAAHLVVMRGATEQSWVPLRVLVAPRLVVAPEYGPPDVVASWERAPAPD